MDANNGYSVGSGGTIVKTTDGGVNWTSSYPTEYILEGVHFPDVNNGWAVGQWGTILRTANAGASWEPQDSQTTAYLESVYFASPSTGWAVGWDGAIFRTTNGGVTWEPQTSGVTLDLNDVFFLDANTGWVVGGELGWPPTPMVILETTDGGEHWDPKSTGTLGRLNSIHLLDANSGWAVGDQLQGGSVVGIILCTRDGGETWSYELPGKIGTLMGVQFVDPDNGWVVGQGGAILHTSTRGMPGCVWGKQQPDGTQVDFGHLVVTSKDSAGVYAEHPHRTTGIKVDTTDEDVCEGDFIYVRGVMTTNGSERAISADSIDVQTAGWGNLPPLGMRIRDIGGYDFGLLPNGQAGVTGGLGPNNIGLLLRTWSKVTRVGAGYLYLDDGSNLKDGTQTEDQDNIGVRVICDPTGYSVDDYLAVTGISSCFKTPTDKIARRILTRGLEDVRRISEP